MVTKKIQFNGKSEILVNFLTSQMSETQLKAINILLNLKYPIPDRQSLCDQIEKVKEREVAHQIVLDTFTPSDFGMDSVYNALEKFNANITRLTQMNPWQGWQRDANWNMQTNRTTEPTQWLQQTTPAQMSNQTTYYHTPWSTPGAQYQAVQPVNSPGGYHRNNWTQQGIPTQGTRTTSWEFNNDICGQTACNLFCDMVNRGVNPMTAYTTCRQKENLCRSMLPNYTGTNAWQAQSIFAYNLIIAGKDPAQADWCARFFLNTCRLTTVVTTSITQPETTPTTKVREAIDALV